MPVRSQIKTSMINANDAKMIENWLHLTRRSKDSAEMAAASRCWFVHLSRSANSNVIQLCISPVLNLAIRKRSFTKNNI